MLLRQLTVVGCSSPSVAKWGKKGRRLRATLVETCPL